MWSASCANDTIAYWLTDYKTKTDVNLKYIFIKASVKMTKDIAFGTIEYRLDGLTSFSFISILLLQVMRIIHFF